MRDEFREQLKEPRVVRHFPSVREEADLNANTHIFVEDASLGVMPIGGRLRQASNFSAEIQGRLDHKTRAIAILKSLTSRYRYNEQSLNELLGAAVAEVAYKLIWHGRAVHEIIRGVESNDAYLLHSFTPRRLFRFPRRYLQIVPKTDRGLWGEVLRYYTGEGYLGYYNADGVGRLPRLPYNAQKPRTVFASPPIILNR